MTNTRSGNRRKTQVVVRLSRIITKTGDLGNTGLADGTRVPKDHPLIEALGAVDELNAWIGLLRSEVKSRRKVSLILGRVQSQLFDLGGELSRPAPRGRVGPRIRTTAASIALLERECLNLNRKLSPLTSFILPGGNRRVCVCHLARTVCRRAERRVAALGPKIFRGGAALVYLNRLSDYLFVLARTLGAGSPETLWKPMENS